MEATKIQAEIVEDPVGTLRGLACHVKAKIWQDWYNAPWKISGSAYINKDVVDEAPDGTFDPTCVARLTFQHNGKSEHVSVVLTQVEKRKSGDIMCEFTTDTPGGG